MISPIIVKSIMGFETMIAEDDLDCLKDVSQFWKALFFFYYFFFY